MKTSWFQSLSLCMRHYQFTTSLRRMKQNRKSHLLQNNKNTQSLIKVYL